VRQLLAAAAVLALSLSAAPAFAFRNLAGCDIVAFAGAGSPVAIPAERWQIYRERAVSILTHAPDAGAPIAEWRTLGNELVVAQKRLLEPDEASDSYRDYLAGDGCRLLAKLNSGSVESLLGEVERSAPEPEATALRRVTQAARSQVENIERAARFRSNLDRTLFAADYYCFVAGAIVALLPPETQQTIALDRFGTTISCRDVDRAG
jgi:hypothetical protein